ncbi:MAG: sigma-54-dependent Fis family transcriptional regulator [Gammaproteobacteria bacterium]|nr:sigma-54-dependent Fis family transcriptional regulator [Gammaproteobacteria bacterium]MCP5416702.1 sigma-54-dependent Fis family transcriptional regulator [Chromatiaceae bacterium]
MTRRYTVLIAEDDQRMADLLAEIAQAQGFTPLVAMDGTSASIILERGEADALLTDLRLPSPDGLALLRLARHLLPDMPTVLITGHATLQVAVDAFRGGLFDLITKPFDTLELEALMDRLRRLLEHRTRTETLSAQVSLLEREAFEPVTLSPASRKVRTLIEQVAPLDVPVLLDGETGTGKSVSARLIHRISPRRDSPFFNLSCAAIAPGLAESELFGHEPGAFTGATGRKRGLLELADGGTLLLDEVNSAGRKVQARLLQFIQERTLLRVGGTRPVPVDVRLIFASNQPLEPLVQKGAFRQDLYFRINVFPVPLPPLRERREDIVPLAEKMLLRFARELERPACRFTSSALESLTDYAWPGNIRELENLVQRAVILAPGEQVDLAHLPLELRPSPGSAPSTAPAFPADATLAQVERIWIEQVLEHCGGNKAETARRLGIDVTTLYRKLKE